MASVGPAGGAGQATRRCRNCDAELGERGEWDCCPECGLPVVLSVRGGEGDGQGVLSGDTACDACAYNLRGLPRNGCCPECGAGVRLPVAEELLCRTEPQYVRKLAHGNGDVSTGLHFYVIGLLIALPVIGVSKLAGSTGMDVVGIVALATVLPASLLSFGGWIEFLCGVWELCMAPPAAFEARFPRARRRLVRIAVVAFPLVGAWNMQEETLAPIVRVGVLCVGLAFLVWLLLAGRVYFRHMQDVAERVPHQRMAWRARRLAAGFTVVLVLLMALLVATKVAGWIGMASARGPLATTFPMTVATPVLNTATIVAWVAWGLFGIVATCVLVVTARLHYQLRESLRKQAALAAEHWTGGRQ